MEKSAIKEAGATLRTLPGDDVRQVLWRYADRYDLQMLVQATRGVARGPVARLVAEGGRNTHEWTLRKAQLLEAFDESGITSVFLDPEQGGFIEGPKNLALALVAFELAWVDAGAATGSLAGNLALAPIHERGTPEQRDLYMRRAAPAKPGENRKPWRGSFCLTEPLPYVGVETGLVSGKVRVAEWTEGKEPILQVDKRGRFITGMGFANFVTVAVDTADERIKNSCMIILEETDPGVFDRGVPTRKLVHQLSSTRDPVFSLRVPANRIIGGYTIKDGVIVPRFSHGEVIEAVFRRTRVTVGVMTAAKLLSAIEPVIRYHRTRFRGSETVPPGSPRYELGLQQREDAVQRLIDVWATGEAGASLGFAAARLFDVVDPLERQKDRIMAERGVGGGTGQMRALRQVQKEALEYLELASREDGERDAERYEALQSDPLVQFMLVDSVANVLCPACKLWDTGHGANMMREAVSLVGGYGITEDCPGFLGNKWMDAQLEATYEGPEAVQRRQLTVTMTNDLFLAQFRNWIREMSKIASEHPETGACALATGMQLWLWTLDHLQKATDANGEKLYSGSRQGVTFPLADALSWLLAARCQMLDVLELEANGAASLAEADALPGLMSFLSDLCNVQSARAAGEAGRICAELVHGYNLHPAADDGGTTPACCAADDNETAASGATGTTSSKDVGLESFRVLRRRLDGCLAGSRLAKDRAAEALTKVMIPEALGYPV